MSALLSVSREDGERLVSSESESDEDDSNDTTSPETPEQHVDLLNLGGSAATTPELQQPAAPSSGSYFDLMSGSNDASLSGGTDQLLDLMAPSNSSAPPLNKPQSNGSADLLGGFDTLSMKTGDVPNASLLHPQTENLSGNLSSHASSSSSLIDQDFMNFMGSSGPTQTGQSSSSTDNLLAGFGSNASQPGGAASRNPGFPTNAAHLGTGEPPPSSPHFPSHSPTASICMCVSCRLHACSSMRPSVCLPSYLLC